MSNGIIIEKNVGQALTVFVKNWLDYEKWYTWMKSGGLRGGIKMRGSESFKQEVKVYLINS